MHVSSSLSSSFFWMRSSRATAPAMGSPLSTASNKASRVRSHGTFADKWTPARPTTLVTSPPRLLRGSSRRPGRARTALAGESSEISNSKRSSSSEDPAVSWASKITARPRSDCRPERRSAAAVGRPSGAWSSVGANGSVSLASAEARSHDFSTTHTSRNAQRNAFALSPERTTQCVGGSVQFWPTTSVPSASAAARSASSSTHARGFASSTTRNSDLP
mmetsp:Transcript_11144/g.33417  ORF Transcript_11144/g.33417 Transcript_11144/m.33417 type:complete len:219 (-) Transcript_11144:309-965(-)